MNAAAIVHSDSAFPARVVAEISKHVGKRNAANNVDQVFRNERTYGSFLDALRIVGAVEQGRAARREYVLSTPVAAAVLLGGAHTTSSTYSATPSAPAPEEETEESVAQHIIAYLPGKARASASPPAKAFASSAPATNEATRRDAMVPSAEEEEAAARIIAFLPGRRTRAESSAPPSPPADAPKPAPVEDDDPEAAEAAREISKYLPRRRK